MAGFVSINMVTPTERAKNNIKESVSKSIQSKFGAGSRGNKAAAQMREFVNSGKSASKTGAVSPSFAVNKMMIRS